MKTVQDVYSEYNIMPNLQLHQLRVAAVGKTICDNFSGEIDKQTVLLACLFHDMGNIIKFDLSVFPEFLKPQGLAHWQEVQNEYFNKYGKEQHAANHAIAVELKLPEKVIECINDVDFSKIETTRDSGSMEKKVCEYSDLRVAPHGIRPMHDRISDIEERYRRRIQKTEMVDRIIPLTAAAEEVERQIFERCSIKPEDINDGSLAPLIEELRNYRVA
jgi:hypothetical protein